MAIKKLRKSEVLIPLDVPRRMRRTYRRAFLAATHQTGRLMLFAGDQKIEHLNKDFYGKGINSGNSDPRHLFEIAARGKIGLFATQLGLIARFGMNYDEVPYLVKLNSKTDIVPTKQKEPYSELLTTVEQVVEFKKNSGLKILGVGYTIYLGSEYEAKMLHQAAQVVYRAHQNGLLAVIWIYPRGKAVKDETDPHLVAGATGIAACLGADFVKVNYPKEKGAASKKIFGEAVLSAGRTGVVCSGGESVSVTEFLKDLNDQLEVGGAGNATGRNIHQKTLPEALKMCEAIFALTIEGCSLKEALKIYRSRA